MIDERELLEQAVRRFEPEPGLTERIYRRRDRKRRNQRIAAGVVGIAVFVAAVWIVTSGGWFDRSETSVVPGEDVTGPATQPTPTPPAGTAPEPAYLIDLNTGEKTQLPKSIAGCCYAASPDGTRVAYVSLDDFRRNQVFIASLDGTDVQQVTQHGAYGPIDWSPDGAAIAYTYGDENVINIFLLDLATGETSEVTHEKPPGAALPQFSPDGASILYEVSAGGDHVSVRIVPVTGGESVLLVGGGKNDVDAHTGTISPDGSTLAVGCFGRLEGICIAHADGTNLHALVSGPQLFGPKWSPDGTRIAYNDQADGPTGNKVFVVDVATGETTIVADGFVEDWLDEHTLIIEPVPQ